jgi:hypothetical protein
MGIFEALRREAADDDAHETWYRALDSLGQHGFPDSQMNLETGHRLWFYRQEARDSRLTPGSLLYGSHEPGYHAVVWHPQGDKGHEVRGYLGLTPELTGPRLRAMFGRRDVMGHMRDQMDRARGTGPDQTGNTLHVDMTQDR